MKYLKYNDERDKSWIYGHIYAVENGKVPPFKSGNVAKLENWKIYIKQFIEVSKSEWEKQENIFQIKENYKLY